MEEDIRAYFFKIVNTIAAILLWLFINIAIGLRLRFAEIQQHITLGNVLYYVWVVLSGILAYVYIQKIWRKK